MKKSLVQLAVQPNFRLILQVTENQIYGTRFTTTPDLVLSWNIWEEVCYADIRITYLDISFHD